MNRLLKTAITLVVACLGWSASAGLAQRPDAQEAAELTGRVEIDGSSMVYPISQAVTVEFFRKHPKVRITVAVSGTGGGFKRFSRGETDVSNASRPIRLSELQACKEGGVEFIELPVAYDALAVVVNPANDWARDMTVADLKKIFLAGGAKTWSDVRDDWPREPIKIYAPGQDSGTYDYFFGDVLNRDRRGEPRRDGISFHEDDNVLVEGVARDKHAISFLGCAYYFENQDKLRAVSLVDDDGRKAAPSVETVEGGTYLLSRPLFIYVNQKSLARPECAAFVEFYLDNNATIAAKVGYVPLNMNLTSRIRKRWEMEHTGTLFLDDKGRPRRESLSEIYAK